MNEMTLAEAVAAVEATLDSPHLHVDRRRARQDEASFLLVVRMGGTFGTRRMCENEHGNVYS